jgi:serine protease AprX
MRDGSAASTAKDKAMQSTHKTRMEVGSNMAIPFVAFRMRWLGATALAGVLVLATLAALGSGAAQVTAASSAAGTQEKLGSSLASLAADKPGSRAAVIVRMAPGEDTAAGHALVKRSGGRVTSKDVPIINGFGASMSAADAKRIASDPRVQAVSLNGGVHVKSLALPTDPAPTYTCPPADATATSPYWRTGRGSDADIRTALGRVEGAQQYSMGVDKAWSSADGSGVGVAVVDTGIAGDMPDFRVKGDSRDSRVTASAVVNPCAKDAKDNYGHGTHMAGLIAGNSLLLDDRDRDYGRYMGIAPKANLVSVKVADDDGATTVLDVINGLQFVVDNKAAYNIKVVNLSLASTTPESYLTDPLDAAAEQAWFKGIVVVAAAGNEGATADAVSTSPGNDPYVISVGAVDDQGTNNISDDVLASWSSRGTTQDGVRKPEVLAPGAHLASTLSTGSDFQQMCPDCKVGDHYFRAGGTSMAAALVSGAAALILDRNPTWTPNQVKGALQNTLRNVPGVGGEVNVNDAMRSTSTSSNTGLTPSTLIDTSNGLIDYTRASFRRASFRDASGSPLDASFARASFRCDCGLLDSGDIDPTRASFRRASFRNTVGFDK